MSEEGPISQQAHCAHCGLPVEGSPDEVLFCCSGCELAASIVEEAGLQRWYQERESEAPRPDTRPLPALSTEIGADGTAALDFRVQGLRCSSCVWLVERVLEGSEGVEHARVSYSTGRAELRFDPDKTSLDTLLTRVQQLGYQPAALAAAPPKDEGLLIRLGVSAFLAANIMLMAASLYLGWLSEIEDSVATLFRWTSLVLSAPIAMWAAEPFHKGAWRAAREGHLHMDLPISLAVNVLFGHALWATIQGQEGYLDSLAMLVTLLLAGRVLDQRGRRAAQEAASALAATAPSRARILVDGQPVTTPSDQLQPGMTLLLSTGEELAADCVVLDGTGMVRTAQLTGESEPVPTGPGELLLAGSTLVQGNLELRIEQAGDQTLLARMAEGLLEANDRPQAPDILDRIAPWFTGATLSVAALSAIGWYLVGGEIMPPVIAVLVVACPCALSLARPLSAAVGLGAAADRGFLARSGDALLGLEQVDVVVMDKTGTLTHGLPSVTEADDKTLRLAAGVERGSIHPIARAIVQECSARSIPIPLGTDLQELPGQGMLGRVDGVQILVQAAGPGKVMVIADGALVGEIALRDSLREDATETLAAIQATGRRVEMLTGDHADVAARIAEQAGIDVVHAKATPESKAAYIAELQEQGHCVLFIGDGINDGPALARADVAVAMSTGAGSSVLVSDAVVAWPSLKPLLAGFRASKAAHKATRSNLIRSGTYNVLAVAAAALGFVNPLVAAVLMPLSSGMVLLGALSIRRKL